LPRLGMIFLEGVRAIYQNRNLIIPAELQTTIFLLLVLKVVESLGRKEVGDHRINNS